MRDTTKNRRRTKNVRPYLGKNNEINGRERRHKWEGTCRSVSREKIRRSSAQSTHLNLPRNTFRIAPPTYKSAHLVLHLWFHQILLVLSREKKNEPWNFLRVSVRASQSVKLHPRLLRYPWRGETGGGGWKMTRII